MPSKQRHIKDIASGCEVVNRFDIKCKCHVVGRVVNDWRIAVCERHAEAMVANGFKVKLYREKKEMQ